MDPTLEALVIETLRTVKDPEIPVDIYELGLIYAIESPGPRQVHVRMTLTAPNCPVAGDIVGEVQQKLSALNAVDVATVELVFDPPWDKAKMSEAAALFMGFEV